MSLQQLRRRRQRVAAELAAVEAALERRLAALSLHPKLAGWARVRYQKTHAERLR